MYVYISPAIKEVTKNNARQLKKILKAKRQIEQGDPLLFGLLFSPRHPHWVKRIGIDFRLIATVVYINKEQILYLVNLLGRGGHEYRNFLDNPDQWGRRNIHINQPSLLRWLAEQKSESPKPETPLMPGTLISWLQKPQLIKSEEKIVFESSEWVEKWQNKNSNIIDQFEVFHGLISQILSIAPGHYKIYQSSRYPHVRFCFDPISKCSIIYTIVNFLEQSERQVFFLLAPYCEQPTEIIIAQLGNTLKLFGASCDQDILANATKVDDLARYARRSYPDYLVYDSDTWQKLEQETEANLALSGEEEELLHDMHFPAFINGRAGSGKSTMLHYAFAYYCHLYLEQIHEQNEEGNANDNSQLLFRPLFLTYSDRLTRRAKDVVFRILSSHVRYTSQNNNHLSQNNIEKLETCFQPFQKFLLDRLTPEKRSKFNPNNYVSFYRFKKLFNHSFPRCKHSAEACWHAIRTYIKGFNFADDDQLEYLELYHDYLSLEEYKEEVYHSHKSIADGDFEEIYQTVWHWYQEQQHQKSYWDDQDLVREVLISMIETDAEKSQIQSQYAAIFCDEAQDFTRIELQVILRLSLWTNYRLIPPVENLPFAFAGDPMQTLNPTGFNWSSFRASFYDRILSPLDPQSQLGICNESYNLLRELRQNYRSRASLVRLGNGIHLWRSILFNLKDLKPQIPWWPDDYIQPQKGITIGNNINLTILELSKIANEGVVFLLPCDEGGELDFLRKYPQANELFPKILENEVPPNVYTSVAVKGMEFSSIIVFGFGEYFAKEFEEKTLDTDLYARFKLKLEYFLNKLYVAVSRSTEILGIVDTTLGDQCLWQAMAKSQQSLWLDRLPGQGDRQIWEKQIDGLGNGFNTKIFKNLNPLQNAITFLESGLEKQDIQNLRSALYYFERAQQQPEAQYCRTWLDRLEGKEQEAGLAFLQITGLTITELNLDPVQDAWECFWQGQHWQELKYWCQRYPQRPQSSWQTAIEFMESEQYKNLKERKQILLTMAGFIDKNFSTVESLVSHSYDFSWREIWQQYRIKIQKLLQDLSKDTSAKKAIFKQYHLFFKTLKSLALAGFEPDKNLALAAFCAYESEDYPLAIATWDQCQESSYREHTKYYFAQAEIIDPPGNLPWLRRAQKPETILKLWQQSPGELNPAWEKVFEDLSWALKQLEKNNLLIELDLRRGLWLQAIQRFQQCFGTENTASASNLNLGLKIIGHLAQDKRLNANVVENQFNDRFQSLDNDSLSLLDLDVEESQWVRVIIRLKRRLNTDITDEDISTLEVYRDQLRSSIFQLFFGDRYGFGEQYKNIVEKQKQQRQILEALIAGKIRGRVLEKELNQFPKDYQSQGAEEADYQRLQWLNLARKSLVDFVANITNLDLWPENLDNIQQAGLALERIGEFGPTLQFYERFRSATDIDILSLSRLRWIETKHKQAEYSQNNNRQEIAERQRKEAQEMTEGKWKKLKIANPKEKDLPQDKNLQQVLAEQLGTLSEAELKEVKTYFEFLKFKRQTSVEKTSPSEN